MPHAHAGGTLRTTFSAGVAAYPACLAGNELTQFADDALLSAKRQGRNCVLRASHPAAIAGT
jgi:PleD family two-component response regulator